MPLETYTIHPTNKHKRPVPPSTIVLHGYDKLSHPIQIRNHRFFHTPPVSFSDVVDKLKSSLAEALELYPPVNGTVQVDKNGNPHIAIDTEKGTPFLVDIRDTPYTGDTQDLSARDDPVLPSTASIFAVKVTQVKCLMQAMLLPSPFTVKKNSFHAELLPWHRR
ncbi:hypothetical protein BJV82DRAFT_507981 [Fennellomyces sp. T-0311]|nr:hypothetical protein BJV82DRAFT_507981 [Fennellomyces sp. T-0311]